MNRNVSFRLTTKVTPTFRTRLVSDTLGLQSPESITHTIHATLPAHDAPWQVGVIVGPSGSGKSTLARLAFPGEVNNSDPLATLPRWPKKVSMLDGFDMRLTHQEIARALMAVGMGNLRDWLKPFHLLSTGQQARAELARTLSRPTNTPAVVDEYTSTLDRTTARLVSLAASQAIRKNSTEAKQAVFVTCHEDVIPWLAPDWVLTMPQGTLDWGSVQRPTITLQLRSCSQGLWREFKDHHYLNTGLHKASRCYALCHEDQAVGFCGTMPCPGRDKRRRKVHRLVVQPQWQGVGAGSALLNAVAEIESSWGDFGIVTSHPGLARALGNNPRWRLIAGPRQARPHTGLSKRFGRTISTHTRLTVSFEYIGHKQEKCAKATP